MTRASKILNEAEDMKQYREVVKTMIEWRLDHVMEVQFDNLSVEELKKKQKSFQKVLFSDKKLAQTIAELIESVIYASEYLGEDVEDAVSAAVRKLA